VACRLPIEGVVIDMEHGKSREKKKNETRTAGEKLITILAAHERNVRELKCQAGRIAPAVSWNGAEYASVFYDLEQVLSTIIHDGKNCLGALKGYTSLLRGELDQAVRDTAQAARYAEIIANDIDSFDRFLKGLSIYRLKGAFSRRPTSFAIIFREALDTFALFNEKNVSVDIDNEAGGIFLLQPEALKRILVHLLRNAYESTGGEGRISLSVAEERSGRSARTERGGFVIKVADDGCGIEQEKLDFIWKPFYTTKPKHFGLGLSFVAVAAAAGISVSLRSTPGSGTTVSLHMKVKGGSFEA